MSDLRIVAAAIKRHGDPVVFTGVRHGHIIKSMVDVGYLTDMNRPVLGTEQGFIDNEGTYWNRAEALVIAMAADQVSSEHSTLYSEDLW